MSLVAVARHWRIPGFDGVRQNVEAAYEVIDLCEALKNKYKTEAHLVAYVVPGMTHQPRINKPGLPHFEHPVEMGVLFCDVDNPNHALWTEQLFADAMEQYERLDVLQNAGIYHTAHGRRIVQPIDSPIPVQEVEPYIRRWFLTLEQAGLRVDWACRDWTRHYRLPHVHRQGRPYRSPWVDLHRMRSIKIPPLEPYEVQIPKPTNRASPPRASPPLEWSQEIPSFWREPVQKIADAVREVSSEWHTLFMAIAGALLSRKTPPEHVPALCRAISLATRADTRTEDRQVSARTTVERWIAGHPTTGYTRLVRQWPGVAAALDEATATGSEARRWALAALPAPEVEKTLEEATQGLEAAIQRAPPGVSLISAACGLGKTEAAIRVAIKRAEKKHTSQKATGARAPLQSKTAISVDKNELAKQIQGKLEAQGVSVCRIFGPLSVTNDDGTPVCRYHAVANPLVAGGQSIQRELCEGRGLFHCAYHHGCTARLGYEGDSDARITIGPHALISALDSSAGSTGLLVIDEPPHLLETKPITLGDLDLVEATASAFDRDYMDAMRPALSAVRAWIEGFGGIEAPTPVKDAIQKLSCMVDPGQLLDAQYAVKTNADALECAVQAPLPDARNKSPPLRSTEVQKLRSSVEQARRVGRASGVLSCIYQAVTAPWPIIGRVEHTLEQPILLVTSARRDLITALRRDGAVVVMDANIKINAPIYEKAMGYQSPLHEFRANDGAPIGRTHTWCSAASRTHWLKAGKLMPKPSLVNAIRELFSWAREDPDAHKLGIITLKPIRLALEAILKPDSEAAQEAWKKAGQLEDTLATLRQKISPIIADWGGEIVLGHYGAVRGLNTMADVDCLATLGDPWSNIGQVAHDMSYLGMPDQGNQRNEDLCRAELEQAHGRLRTIHRKRPGRALHIGRVLPSGTGWRSPEIEFRRMKVGRPGPCIPMSADELERIIAECGSISAAARRGGCSRSYLQKCLRGERGLSAEIAAVLRNSRKAKSG